MAVAAQSSLSEVETLQSFLMPKSYILRIYMSCVINLTLTAGPRPASSGVHFKAVAGA